MLDRSIWIKLRIDDDASTLPIALIDLQPRQLYLTMRERKKGFAHSRKFRRSFHHNKLESYRPRYVRA